jgi:predicted DNA-binding transcriptional regulator YafY
MRPGASGAFLRIASEHLRGPVASGVASLVFPSEAAAAAFLAGHVTEVEVLSPVAVRRRLADLGRRLVAAYATPARGTPVPATAALDGSLAD